MNGLKELLPPPPKEVFLNADTPWPKDIGSEIADRMKFDEGALMNVQESAFEMLPKPQDMAGLAKSMAGGPDEKLKTVAIIGTPPVIIVSTLILLIAIMAGAGAGAVPKLPGM